jgi:hypothetical protein
MKLLCFSGDGAQGKSTRPLSQFGPPFRFCSSCCVNAMRRQICFARAYAQAMQQPQHSSLSPTQEMHINKYLTLLLSENQKYNLTAIKDRNEAYERHVLDSLALIEVIEKHLPIHGDQGISLLDIGSGPGLPGCILAIARPNWEVGSPTPNFWLC